MNEHDENVEHECGTHHGHGQCCRSKGSHGKNDRQPKTEFSVLHKGCGCGGHGHDHKDAHDHSSHSHGHGGCCRHKANEEE